MEHRFWWEAGGRPKRRSSWRAQGALWLSALVIGLLMACSASGEERDLLTLMIRTTDVPGPTEYDAADELAEALRNGPAKSVCLQKLGQARQGTESLDLRILLASTQRTLAGLSPEMTSQLDDACAPTRPESCLRSIRTFAGKPALILLGSDEAGLSIRNIVKVGTDSLWDN
jgi:hypothetical protein